MNRAVEASWTGHRVPSTFAAPANRNAFTKPTQRSEEHTSELQSQSNLVCRLLLEKKKKTNEQDNLRSCNKDQFRRGAHGSKDFAGPGSRTDSYYPRCHSDTAAPLANSHSNRNHSS